MRIGRSDGLALRRAGAALLAGLLLAAGSAGALQLGFRINLGGRRSNQAGRLAKGVAAVSLLAGRLAKEVGAVKGRFAAARGALPTVAGPGGQPVHPRRAVAELIDVTEGDLDRAIAQMGEPGLAALRDWAAEGFRQARGQLEAPAGVRTVGYSGPRAVAVVASLGGAYPPPLTPPSSPDPATAGDEAERSDQVLQRVERILERLFVLADKDDLEVSLWVGSTPAERATFRFWSQGFVKGSPPAPIIVRTNGTQKRVLRGLYSYSAALGGQASIEYPAPAGAVTARHAGFDQAGGSERLDLVNGSGFFCCRFEESYCHHVDDARDCQPDKR
jgi:hypothetical protein